ncbi:MAG: precorrin-2 C(20)-methyltransferase [Lachnospiraceae bacterium]|nr:precorrin-2 C(20)-methyltransferase [Lachnospiraceae bacterium]
MRSQNTEAGILYGIGVGPGDPELMTTKAVRLVRECDILAIPAKESSDCTAYQIAVRAVPEIAGKPVLPVSIPMTRDRAELDAAYLEGCAAITQRLEEGKNIAFLNLGDPTIYSTYMTIHDKIRQAGYDAVIVSGVPSFCAVAAALEIPIAAGRETIHILPGCYGQGELSLYPHTKILMKSGGSIYEVKRELEELETGGQIKAYAVSNCGMPEQRIYEKIGELDEQSGYFTTVIVKETKK